MSSNKYQYFGQYFKINLYYQRLLMLFAWKLQKSNNQYILIKILITDSCHNFVYFDINNISVKIRYVVSAFMLYSWEHILHVS